MAGFTIPMFGWQRDADQCPRDSRALGRKARSVNVGGEEIGRSVIDVSAAWKAFRFGKSLVRRIVDSQILVARLSGLTVGNML